MSWPAGGMQVGSWERVGSASRVVVPSLYLAIETSTGFLGHHPHQKDHQRASPVIVAGIR